MNSLLGVILCLAVISFCFVEVFGSNDDSTELKAEPRYHYKPKGKKRILELFPVKDNTVSTEDGKESVVVDSLDLALTTKARKLLDKIEQKVKRLVDEVRSKGPEVSKCFPTQKVDLVNQAFQQALRDENVCRLEFAKSTSTTNRTETLGICVKNFLAKVEFSVKVFRKELLSCYSKTTKHHDVPVLTVLT